MDYIQYGLLLGLVESVVGSIAASCGSCKFFDSLIETCASCSLICPLEIKRCKRLCSDWPECVLSTMTPLTSTTPGHWPWIVGSVVAFVLFTIVVGVTVWCKPCHRGGRRPFWRRHKDEVRSSVESPLMLQDVATGPSQGDVAEPPQGDATGPPQGGATGPPQGDATGPPQGNATGPPQDNATGPPQNGATGPPRGDATEPPQGDATGPPQGNATGPHHGCTAACSKPKGVHPVCCPNKGPSSDHQFVPSGSTKNHA